MQNQINVDEFKVAARHDVSKSTNIKKQTIILT